MDGKEIDEFVKQSLTETANKKHRNGPDAEKNWALIEAALQEKPKKRAWLYVAAAAIALLLFSNFYWMMEQRSYKEQVTAIVLTYEQELAKKPPAAPVPEKAPIPEAAPAPPTAPQLETAPEQNVKIVYVDRIVEVPVEVPVEVHVPVTAEPPQTAAPPREPESDEHIATLTRADQPNLGLLPPSRGDESTNGKNENNKSKGERSFGLKLALKQQ